MLFPPSIAKFHDFRAFISIARFFVLNLIQLLSKQITVMLIPPSIVKFHDFRALISIARFFVLNLVQLLSEQITVMLYACPFLR